MQADPTIDSKVTRGPILRDFWSVSLSHSGVPADLQKNGGVGSSKHGGVSGCFVVMYGASDNANPPGRASREWARRWNFKLVQGLGSHLRHSSGVSKPVDRGLGNLWFAPWILVVFVIFVVSVISANPALSSLFVAV